MPVEGQAARSSPNPFSRKKAQKAQKPTRTPREPNYDAWISYQRKSLSGRVEWKTQLNVRNLFTDNDLIPVGRNPDGSVAVWSIAEGRKFTLATKFSFQSLEPYNH